jgi:hypothetical protein
LVEQPLGEIARRLADLLWFEDHVRAQRSAAARASTSSGAGYFIPHDNRPRLTFPRRYPTRERLAAMIAGVVEGALEKPNLRIIGSKTPGHWSSPDLALVREAFARVRYVFMVRNPLDTINSIVNRRNAARVGADRWPDKPVEEAIAQYQESTALLHSCAMEFPGDTFVVKYDDLLAQPDRTLGALGAFLGMAVEDRSHLVTPHGASAAVLTRREDTAVRAAFDAAIATWHAKNLTGPAAAVMPALSDCLRTIVPGRTYRCDAPHGDRAMLGSGWNGAEPRGILTDASTAHIHFTVPQGARYRITLEGRFDRPEHITAIEATLIVAGVTKKFRSRPNRKIRVTTEPIPLRAAEPATVTLTLSPPQSHLHLSKIKIHRE